MSRNAKRRLKRAQKQGKTIQIQELPDMWQDTPEGNARFWQEANANLSEIGIPDLNDPSWML